VAELFLQIEEGGKRSEEAADDNDEGRGSPFRIGDKFFGDTSNDFPTTVGKGKGLFGGDGVTIVVTEETNGLVFVVEVIF